jgi:phasin
MADIKPKFEVPKFDIPTVEVPKIMRELAEKSLIQAKDAYAKFKSAAEETTDMLEDTYTVATKGASEFNLKALEALRLNMNSAFDYTSQLLASKNLAEAVELSSSHVRKQFETLSAQAKEFATIAQKVATKTSEPIKTGVSKFKMQ